MNPLNLILVLLGVICTHLSLVSTLPWKSPPKWRLPPLPKRSQEEADTDLLSRVQHLEGLVQKRLEEKQKLNRYRELERIIAKKLAEEEDDDDDTHDVVVKGDHNSKDKVDTQKDLKAKSGGRGDPEILTRQKLDELAAQLDAPYHSESDPIVELKEITRDLELLVDKFDRQRRERSRNI